MDAWEQKRILVLGTTYPNYSAKYVETVCTGGIEEDTYRMVRIHPLPVRYLDDDKRFKNFQFIRGRFCPNEDDGRPESLRIEPDTIEALEEIPSKDHETRRQYIERSPNFVASVEDLIKRNGMSSQSLGVVVPKEIIGVKVRKRPQSDRAEWEEKERQQLSQRTLKFMRPPKKLDYPEAEFQVAWKCDDPGCGGHEMGMKTWGLHELYRKLAGDPQRDRKVQDKMSKMFDLKERDVFLFLGSFVTRKYQFGLMDAYCPPRKRQLDLLGV